MACSEEDEQPAEPSCSSQVEELDAWLIARSDRERNAIPPGFRLPPWFRPVVGEATPAEGSATVITIAADEIFQSGMSVANGAPDVFVGTHLHESLPAGPVRLLVDARVEAAALAEFAKPLASRSPALVVIPAMPTLPAWLQELKTGLDGAEEEAARTLFEAARRRVIGSCDAGLHSTSLGNLISAALGQTVMSPLTVSEPDLASLVRECGCEGSIETLREVYDAALARKYIDGHTWALRFPRSIPNGMTVADLLQVPEGDRVAPDEVTQEEPAAEAAAEPTDETSPAESALGALMGDQVGTNFGFGGLGLRPSGDARAESLRAAVRDRRRTLRQCHRQRVALGVEPRGAVQLTVRIGPTGAVSTATVAEVGAVDALMERCMVRTANEWRFDAGEGTSVITESFDFGGAQ